MLIERCITGLQVNEARSRQWMEQSAALATAVAPYLGYHTASDIAREATERNCTIRDILLEKGLFTPEELNQITAAYELTTPGIAGEKHVQKRVVDESTEGT